MTKRALLVLLVVVALPVHADFNSVARAIDAHPGVKRIWIPFLGLARAIVWVARPEGVHDFQLATFEGGNKIGPERLKAILEQQAGPGFRPLVRSWSRHSSEMVFVFAKPQPNGSRIELLVLSQDDEETVLVRVDVDADVLARELDDPRNVSQVALR